MPCSVSVGMASSRAIACRCVSDGRGVLLDAGGLDGGDVLGGLPGNQPLGRELLVSAAEHRQPPGDRGRRHAVFEQAALVELDVVGGDLQRCDALGLHVADEIHEVAAIGFDRVVRQQGVADPGHQGPGDGGRSAAGLQGVGQEGLDLVGGRGVALEEIAALGDEGRAGRPGAGVAGGDDRSWESERHRLLDKFATPRLARCPARSAGSSGPGVAGRPCHCSGKMTLASWVGARGV